MAACRSGDYTERPVEKKDWLRANPPRASRISIRARGPTPKWDRHHAERAESMTDARHPGGQNQDAARSLSGSSVKIEFSWQYFHDGVESEHE